MTRGLALGTALLTTLLLPTTVGAAGVAAVAHVDVETRIYTFAPDAEPTATLVSNGIGGLAAATSALPPSSRLWLYVQPRVVPDLGPSPTARLGTLVKEIGASGIDVRTAQVLSLRDEAAFTWFAYNAEADVLDAPLGILDLRDGRLLFAYVPEPDAHAARPFLAGDREFELYAAGYEGLDRLDSQQSEACYPTGQLVRHGADLWFPSQGDSQLCQRTVFAGLAKACKSPPCSLMGTPQPHVTGKFLAFGDFAVLAGQATPFALSPDFYMKAARDQCAPRTPSPTGPWVSPMACHTSVMLATVLGPGIGFRGNSKRIQLATAGSSAVPAWARGVVAARDNP
jgi:hypothetical protein